MTSRCAWAGSDPLMQTYHDTEWGVPERDPRALWEKLMLDGFQAGLAWITILRKRETLRAAFAGFDPEKVARFDEADVARLLQDPGIIRSRAKIDATIGGARAYLAMRDRGEDFSTWAWSFTDGKPLRGDGTTVPAKTDLSETDLEGPQAPRLQVRRPDDRLRLDAGDRHRQRPRRPLLPPRRRLIRRARLPPSGARAIRLPMSLIGRLFRLLATLVLLLALTAFAVMASAIWFATHPPSQTAGVLIVLGGMMTPENTLASQSKRRVEVAVALYNAGAAPRIHFTGGTAANGEPAPAEQMRALAIALGVPAGATSVENESESTLQNALFSRPVLGPLANGPVMLVTDGFHMVRSWASFRWAGYKPVRLAAATAFGDEPLPVQIHWVRREAMAWWYNPVRVIAYEILERFGGPDPERIRMLD